MLLLKNGHVIDPLNHIDGVMDVAVENGRIQQVGTVEETASNTIDASGCYVVPGLVDHHCHIYPLAGIGCWKL